MQLQFTNQVMELFLSGQHHEQQIYQFLAQCRPGDYDFENKTDYPRNFVFLCRLHSDWDTADWRIWILPLYVPLAVYTNVSFNTK